MKVFCRDLGQMDYKACWDLQQSLFDALTAAKTNRTAAPEGKNKVSPAANAAREAGPDSGNTGTDTGTDRRNTGTATTTPDGGKVAPRTETGPATNPAEREDPETGNRAEEAGTILLVEHPPVYTLGKSGHAENLLVGREALEAMGAQFFHIDRGGDITFHGPGQLVCYPILDLEGLGIGLRAYIDALEEAVIRTVARYGIRAGRIAGASGVWVGDGTADEEGTRSANDRKTRNAESGVARTANDIDNQTANEECRTSGNFGKSIPRKICAIGVRSSRYITMHGFALNVTTDLEWFSRINPCGFTDRGVTSIERETGQRVRMDEVKELVLKFFSEILNVRIYK